MPLFRRKITRTVSENRSVRHKTTQTSQISRLKRETATASSKTSVRIQLPENAILYAENHK